MTNKLTITYQTDKMNEGVMTMTSKANHQASAPCALQKELNTIRLISKTNLDAFRFEALRNYAIKQVTADKDVSLDQAQMHLISIEGQKESISDVFSVEIGGYRYYGMIHKIGMVEDKIAYRMIAVDVIGGYPVICEHEGLGKLFDYCEDHQGVFFINPKETTPIDYVKKLVKQQDLLEYGAYGFYEFDQCPPLTQVIVNNFDVLINESEGDIFDKELFEQAIADMVLLKQIQENPHVDHFQQIMEMIEDYSAYSLCDYYGIKPFCGCKLAEAIESFEEGSE